MNTLSHKLREQADFDEAESTFGSGSYTRELMREAADALELRPGQWQPQFDVMAARDEAVKDGLITPVWTPVSTLPQPGRKVIATYLNQLGNRRTIVAQWIAAKTEEADIEADNFEYDEATDTNYTPEGWYECVDNWDDYSSVRVYEGEITHWMPLPAAPGGDG